MSRYLLSVPLLVLLLGIWLLLPLPRPAWLSEVDSRLFRLAAMLRPAPAADANLALVTLDADQQRMLQQDAAMATAVSDAVDALLGRTAAVGLVLPVPPRLPAQELLQWLPAGQGGALGEYRGRALRWQRWLDQGRLTLGLPAAAMGPAAVTVQQQPPPTGLWHSVAQWLRAEPPALSAPVTADRALPTAARQRPARPLVWRAGDGLIPDLALWLHLRQRNATALRWQPGSGLQASDGFVLPAPAGDFVPLYGAATGLPDSVVRVALEDADDAAGPGTVVLLGAVDDPLLLDAAGAVASLQQGAYLTRPGWWWWGEPALLLLLVAYLMLLPKLPAGTRLLGTVLVAVLLVSGQLGWQWARGEWLALGVALQYLLAGAAVMLLWAERQRHWQALRRRSDEAHLALAEQYFQQHRLDDALATLASCRNSEPVLSLTYDIAAQQERRRQYGQAAATYRQLAARRRRGYRDAASRAEQLDALAGTVAGDNDLAATRVLPEVALNNPLLGRYEIERELGRGAMGVVYLGRDPKIGRRVALKTLSYTQLDPVERDEVKERFFREAEAAGRLNHPHIVTVFDVGEEHDLAYIAMDFAPGQPLSAFTRPGQLLPTATVYSLMAQVAEALAYAHGENIVHRDIKPSNIIYNADNGQVKVTDFGIARITDSAHTRTGDILGSPLYMSPEQLKGQKVQGASDIYSLGVTFYQLLTGALPFAGDSIANVAYEIINKKYRSVRELRPELPASAVRIVNKAMHKAPAKRYADAGEMAEALRRALARDFDREAVS